MIFTETELAGAYIIDLDRRSDDRGWFARMFCQDEFREYGLEPLVAQANISFNRVRGTLRGLHFQLPPAAESKYVRCTRGAVLDVIVDLRPESATYLRHTKVELSADNGRGIYVPQRFAHGYQALEDGSETTYMIDQFYAPQHESGLRYDDPRLGIEWPLPVSELSDKDTAWRQLDAWEPELVARMTREVGA
ncbi:MAG: dTDP-4-dehydrorhamnose 3,5-epimerase [Candidatus Limnocylindrales bacterium]